MIPTKLHGIFDYAVGASLLLVPFAFGLSDIPDARNLFLFSGMFLVAYSLATDYELSLTRVVPRGLHMTLDMAIAVMLAVAPFLFDYRAFLTPVQAGIHYGLSAALALLVALTAEAPVRAPRTRRVSRAVTLTPMFQRRM